MHPPSERDLAIERGLRAAAMHVERASGGAWRMAMSNGTVVDLCARVAGDDWLELKALFPWTTSPAPLVTASGTLWHFLQINRRLDGSARLARSSSGDLEMRAEIFIGTDSDGENHQNADIQERVRALCEDVSCAWHESLNGPPDSLAQPDRATSAMTDSDQLARLCADAGWNAVPQAPGDVRVTLDTPTSAFQAALSLAVNSHPRAVVVLSTAPILSGTSRDAMALLLLDVAAHVRTVKGVTVRHGDAELPGVAAACENRALTPAALDRALAALAVACTAVGREVSLLQDESLARAYLALRQPVRRHTAISGSHELEDMSCLQLP